MRWNHLNASLAVLVLALPFVWGGEARVAAAGGPPKAAVAAKQFIPLPDVTNAWHRFNTDVQYYFTAKVGVGVGCYDEKLDVTTSTPSTPTAR